MDYTENIICTNCNHKTNSQNTFCSHCGKTLPNHLITIENKIDVSKNNDTTNNTQTNNSIKKEKIKDGLVFSIISIVLFALFLLPYITELLLKIPKGNTSPGDSAGWGLGLFIFGIIIALPTFLSFILTIINILTLIPTGIFVLIVILFFTYILYLWILSILTKI